jgi:uncharacterized protein (AIM24 family)
LGANIENHGGFDILKFNISPGASVITNQETLSYMDGGLSTTATMGSGGIFDAIFRGITGASTLQNAVVNPTQNILKMVLSPLIQGSVVQVDIKPGETWRFADKSFIACTPNMNVGGNINIFSNFRMMFVGENLTYTTVSANQGTAGSVWISAYGAVEKHEINMGTGSTVPLFINNGCFLGMIESDQSRNFWHDYVSVGTASGLFNAMFTQLGWIMKIQESIPSRGPAKCVVLTQSLNPHNFEKYIASIAQKVVEQNKSSQRPSYLQSGVGSTATAAVLGSSVAASGAPSVPVTGSAPSKTPDASKPINMNPSSNSKPVNMNPSSNSKSANTGSFFAAPFSNSKPANTGSFFSAPSTNSQAAPPVNFTPATNSQTTTTTGGSRKKRKNRKSSTRRR